MGIPRVVATDRLLLTIPGPAEAPDVLSYFERNRDHLEPWEPARPEGFYTTRFWRGRLEIAIDDAALGTAARYFLVRRDVTIGAPSRVVGTCNFTNIVDGAFQACHLGYGLDESSMGTGLMHEAIAAALPLIMEKRELHRVMANYMPENERSGRVLERLGFVVEGFAREYLFINGAWRDHILTSYTRG